MSETIKTGWIKDEDNNKLAPKTVIGQVLNGDGTVFNPVTKTSELDNDKGFVTTDTKNTAGATDTDTGKLYLVGASSQINEAQTYTDKNTFIDEEHNTLYSNGYGVLDNESESRIFNASIYGDLAKAGSSGIAQLTIGSSKSLSQDGDYVGHVYQYSDNNHYTDLVPALGLNTNPVITLPSKNGILATMEDASKVIQKYDETNWEGCLLLSGYNRNYSTSDYFNNTYRSKKISGNPGIGAISVIVDDIYTDSDNIKHNPYISITDSDAYVDDIKIGKSVAKFEMEEKGTSDVLGKSYVQVGNMIPKGTNGNSKGYIYVYDNGNKYTSIESSDELTENIQLILPSNSGKLALENDINVYGVATSSALGLVKSGTDITVDSSGNVSVNDDSHNHVISNVDGLQNALDGKASSSHTHNDYINQNAFSNVVVGSTTVAADSATDTLTLVAGSNVTITPDATNDKITISSTDTNTWRPLGTGSNDACAGNDSRLSNARPASDVYSWAKASSKPSYTWDEITSKPSTFTPASHTHDDRYYTESEIDSKLNAKLNTSLKGSASGLAELDANGKVPSSQLPSFVDDVLEYSAKSNFPTTGETGKIYVDTSTNLTYRWSGSAYVEISPSLALGETSSTAYRGDRGKTAYDHSQSTHARTDATKVEKSSTNGNIKINGTETTVYTHPSGTNPHGTTKSDVGLGNVPNVATNDQTPSYTEATSLTKLTSGEKVSVAFGKISKAITDLIAHIGDSVKHITSTERTNWNSAKTHADSTHAPSNAQANVIETVKVNGTALTPSSKAVDISVPTKVSQLTNDSGYKTTDNNTTYSLSKSGSTITLTGSDGSTTSVTDSNTTYGIATTSDNGLMSSKDKGKLDGIESGAQKNTITGVKGNSESSYRTGNVNITAANIGLGNVGNFKAVSTVASQSLTDTEKSNARANIGAGTSSFSGSYNDLTNKPTIPTVGNGTITITQNGTTKGTFTTNQSGNTTIALTDTDTNTTYSSKSAASGGTDVSLVTTGEKYTWNNKANASHGTHVPSTCTTITDWNNATSTGWYMGSGVANAPTNGWYFGYVIAHNTNYVVQEIYQFTASTDAKAIPKYIRAKMNGTWGSWTDVTVQKKVPSDAKFTDTDTWRGIQNNLASDSTTDSLSAAQGKALKALIDGKAAISHGNHIPDLQTANNAVFLRNDNTWQTVTPANIGAATSDHSHSSYINQLAFSKVHVKPSSSSSSTTAIQSQTTTDEFSIYAGSNVSLGVDSTYKIITINATDTNTWRGIQNNLASDSTSDSLSAAQGKILKGLVDGKASKEWTLVGSGTSVDVSTVYSNAYEWYIAVVDSNGIITDFNLPYNETSISGKNVHIKGYYYDSNYYGTIGIAFNNGTNIAIASNWTKVQYGSGKTSNTATLYVYYR